MAYDIRLLVDDATGMALRQALAIVSRYFTVPLAALSPIPAGPSIPRALSVSGLRILLDIGRAGARPGVQDDPARFFAVFRYAQALAGSRSVLTLAQPFYDLDSHKKRVLSDEFGCGLAFIVATDLLRATGFLDFETAVAMGLVRTSAPRSRRPDYVGFLPSGTPIILEAKGTQQGVGYARGVQILSGCRQVTAPRLLGRGVGEQALRLVVASALYYEQWSPDTTVFLGDPDDVPTEDYVFEEEFVSSLVRGHYMRVASLIGDHDLTSRLKGATMSLGTGGELLRTIRGQRYFGSQIIIEDGRGRAGFFIGLESRLREELLRRAAVLPERRPSNGVRSLGESLHTDDLSEIEPLARREDHVAAEDGTVCQVWIE